MKNEDEADIRKLCAADSEYETVNLWLRKSFDR